MKFTKRFTALFLVFAMVLSLNTISLNIVSNAATENYKQSLRDKGFPESYVTKLAQLHDLYPSWQFEPIMVTEKNSTLTWDYVINKENSSTGSSYYNLVTTSSWAPGSWNSLGAANYTPYHDSSDTGVNDTGTWKKASKEAVEYFMDPRNFLNDTDIFMFEYLGYNEKMHTVENVNITLAGSFMANANHDGGSTSYAQLIKNLGVQYDISPVFIASRLKQEKGATRGPLENGALGDKLWSLYTSQADYDGDKAVWGSVPKGTVFTEAELKQYNGYYNFFNMGAAGTGVFAIYLNGGKEALGAGWNTEEASISGGTAKLKNRFVSNDQFNLYLQKFDVAPKNNSPFSQQYMQNIAAPLTEGRTTRNTYRDAGLLSEAHMFKIPVYSGMPSSACPDPANGNSYYSSTPMTVPTSYAVTATAIGNGTVGFDDSGTTTAYVTPGNTVHFFTRPNDGYRVKSISVDGVDVAVQSDGQYHVYNFVMPSAGVGIEVTFGLDINPVDIVFNNQDIMNWVISGGVSVGVSIGLGTEGDWHGMFISPSTSDNDPQAYFNFTSIDTFDASKYKYMTLIAKTTATNKNASMFYCAGDTVNPTADCVASWQWINDGLWHEYVIDLSDLSLWSGNVNMIRFDFFDGTTPANSKLMLQSMRFSENAPSKPSISTNASIYTVGQNITINYSGLSSYYDTAFPLKPFVAIYADGTEPGKGSAVQYTYVNNESGILTFPSQATGGTGVGMLPVGNYRAWLAFDGMDKAETSYILNNVHINNLEGYSFAVVEEYSGGMTDYVTDTGSASNQTVINAVAGHNVTTAIQNIMTLTGSSNVTIKDIDGNTVLTSATVATGMIATVDGVSYGIVIKGDVDCDGAITIADASAAYSHLMGTTTLSNASMDAAKETSSSASLNIIDVMNLLNMI